MRSARASAAVFCLFALAITLASCSGGGDASGPSGLTGGYTLNIATASPSIEQGGTGTLTASIGRTGSFTQSVQLSTENVPNGVTAAFSPSLMTSGTASTTLTVTVAASVVPGSYTFTIRGAASGLADQTTSVAFTVTARPTIALTVVPASLSITQGTTAAYTAVLARTNYTGVVSVAVSGAPAEITFSVTNTADAYTIKTSVAANAEPGSYTLTMTASGTGVVSATATVTLVVVASSTAPAIDIAATPSAISAAPGASVSTTIAVTRTNFAGTVVVAVQSGLPTGVTATSTPNGPTLVNSVQVTFNVGAAVTPGSYPIVLQGSGFQALAGTTTVTLTVTAAAGGVVLSAAPTSLSIQQGGQASTTIALTRTNYAGSVTLNVTGAPTGMTLSVSPAITTGNSATLGVAVGGGAAPGSYSLTVTATGTGLTSAPITIPVTATTVSTGGNVTWRFCAATGIPIWFAYQNGGPGTAWTSAGAVGNAYSFTIGAQGAVAYVMQSATNSFTTNVVHGSLAELSAQGTTTCGVTPLAGKTVTGSVTGVQSPSDFVQVSMGTQFATPAPSQTSPNFQIAGVLDGARDLIGTRSAFSTGFVLNRLFIKRGLNPPNLGSVGVVDFTGGDSFAPETRTLTLANLLGGETVSASNTWYTANSSFGSLGASSLTSATTLTLPVVPASRTIAGDVQMLAVSAATIVGSTVTHIRSLAVIDRNPTAQTLTLGGALNSATVTVAATAPYARLRAQLTRQAEYNDSYSANFAQNVGATSRTMTVSMSAAYLGAAGTLDVSVPDLSGAAGWLNSWGLATGTSTTWNVAATGWIALNGALLDGARWRTAQRQGTIVP